MRTSQKTDHKSRQLALRIASENTDHHKSVDAILKNAQKIFTFLIGGEQK